MFIRIISFLVVILILTSCDGGLNVSGNIYESNILSKGTDSVVIELRDKDFKLLVSSISNKSGSFF